jgi:hypothetical protein
LPELPEAEKKDADMAWFIYDLLHDKTSNTFKLQKIKTKYTNYSILKESETFCKYSLDDFTKNLIETIEYGQ